MKYLIGFMAGVTATVVIMSVVTAYIVGKIFDSKA